MRTYKHYTIITEYGETLKKIKHKLYDKKDFKEINRIIEKELHTNKNEKFIVENITVIVAHNKQLKINL